MSKDSNIHIWDFLCLLPISNDINVFYTTDSHFKHEIFTKFPIIFENPIEEWEDL